MSWVAIELLPPRRVLVAEMRLPVPGAGTRAASIAVPILTEVGVIRTARTAEAVPAPTAQPGVAPVPVPRPGAVPIPVAVPTSETISRAPADLPMAAEAGAIALLLIPGVEAATALQEPVPGVVDSALLPVAAVREVALVAAVVVPGHARHQEAVRHDLAQEATTKSHSFGIIRNYEIRNLAYWFKLSDSSVKF